MKKVLLILLTLLIYGESKAQVSDFDSNDGLTLILSGGVTSTGATSLFPSGSVWGNTGNARSISNETGTITTTSVTTTQLSTFSVDMQSIAGTSGNGNDGSDEVTISVSTDGGSNFTTIVTVNGNNNAQWTYAGGNAVSTPFSTPVTVSPAGGGGRDDDMDGIESVTITNIPIGDVVIEISATNNSSNEYWVFDNLSLTQGAAACSISGVAVNNETCSGTDFTFEVSFNASNGSGTYEVIDVSNSNTVLASGSSSPITVTISNNSSTTPFDINVWDQNENTCIGDTDIEVTPVDCTACEITNVMATAGECVGPNFEFEVSFSVVNGSGTYEVIDESDGNAVLASGSSSPIMVSLTNNTSNTDFDINVWDQNENTCIGTAVTVSPEICPQNGINCWDTNGNGINDMSEDTNSDGNFDALDCQGATGATGPAGANGTDGADGQDGSDGINCWDTNGNGMNDMSEDTNSDGNFDALDCQGADGTDGTDGVDGMDGDPGDPGTDGADGQDGTDGINCWDTNGNGVNDMSEDTNSDGNFDALDCQGADGADGQDGDDGADGAQGDQGPVGNDGADGADGANGINCWDTNGNGVNDMSEDTNSDGNFDALDCQGADGTDGQDGDDGADGAQGDQGPAGNDGADGANGINCWDTNGNGVNDMSEDTNSDGNFDALDCQGATGADGAQGPEGPQGPQGDPASADGNGLYSGNGIIPSNTTALITDVLNLDGDIAISGEILGLSDERLKINKTRILNALVLLNQLNPVKYNFDTQKYSDLNLSESLQFGLLAQEVELILPNLVKEAQFHNGQTFKSINYDGLISVVIAAVKEQDEKISKQQDQIDSMQKQINALKELIEVNHK